MGIVRGDVRAGARVVTLSDDDTMFLEGDPYVAQETDQLSGDRIFVAAPDGELSRVLVTGRALASYRIEPETPGDEVERGTVSGDTLTMFFEEGEPVLTVVHGGAGSEHVVGASGERNDVSARELTVLFSEGGRSSGPSSAATPREPTASCRRGGESPPAGGPAGRGRHPRRPPCRTRPRSRACGIGRRRSPTTSGGTGSCSRDGATVEYKGTVLRADEIVFDPDTEVLSASGSPDFSDEGERLVGDTLAYDLNRQTGSIVEGATTFEDGLYYGDRIERDTDGSLRVRGGVYTTCSAARPHYRLVSHQMRIYLDDKVVARPVILYIGDLPVLALPFYVFPIRKGRQSGFLIPQIEFGFSEGGGRFIRNFGYYWAPNDHWDVTAWADYYDQTRWIAHLQTRYALQVRPLGVRGGVVHGGDARRAAGGGTSRWTTGRSWAGTGPPEPPATSGATPRTRATRTSPSRRA